MIGKHLEFPGLGYGAVAVQMNISVDKITQGNRKQKKNNNKNAQRPAVIQRIENMVMGRRKFGFR
ncbi:MAG: hypothetical protein U9P10_03900 [Thermodesulfobacteriota bacterium]|nr:hypothetical protein [Thermodesulfobacteriota bacterium]